MKKRRGGWVAASLVFSITTVCAGVVVIPTSNLTIVPGSEPFRELGNWVDTDKSHGGAGGWGANYYNDLNANGSHDPGEPFAEDPQGGWTNTLGTDNSCWLASACNMLEQIGLVASASALYDDYALNGVPDGDGGTITWDDEGLHEYAIQHWKNQNPGIGAGLSMSTHWRSFTVSYTDAMFAWEDWAPRDEVDDYLNTGWEVGIGMWPLYTDGLGNFWHEDGHALTIQDIDPSMTFDCTDSDRDADWTGPGDLNTYTDATRGPTPYEGHNYYAWYNDFYDGNILVYPVGDVGYVCAIIPEPATICLLGLGALGLLRKRRA